jgi:hypothetical protein
LLNADLRFSENSHIATCGTDIYGRFSMNKWITWKGMWIKSYLLLVWVVFMKICESYVHLSGNWFLRMSIRVVDNGLDLKNDVWMGKINILYIWKLDLEIVNLELVLYHFDLFWERYEMPQAGFGGLILNHERDMDQNL